MKTSLNATDYNIIDQICVVATDDSPLGYKEMNVLTLFIYEGISLALSHLPYPQ